ncbi:MAG: recombinase family protein [Gammaproteobacteria bacterium]|nr:recombinase family protein [Gammaproteobacteria bacterium]
MKVGYARVSTRDQTLDNQLSRLTEAGCEMFFEEKVSGAARKRPELETMLKQLRKDDVVVITKLDRLARSTIELLRITEVLNEKSAGIQSLAEPWADTTSPGGKMIMTVFGGIAEFERSLILTRTQEGREAAQARGVAFGRSSKLRNDQKELVLELVNTGQSVSAVARTFNVHPATIYRCLNEHRSL